jgi:actin-like protein 6A
MQAEPVTATRADRETMAEIWFEKFEVPAYFTAKDAVLSCFAAARQSGLVIDVGGGSTKVTAVHAGFALASTSYSSDLGGERLTEELGRALQARDPPIQLRPLYEVRATAAAALRAGGAVTPTPANVTTSYREWATAQVVEEAKETACRVSETPFDVEAASKASLLPSHPVELMGEETVDVGGERFAVPELLFDPTPLGETRHKPLLRAITDVVAAVDVDIRRDLYASVLVTGGVTQTDGFTRRLEADLASTVADSMFKVRVVASAFGNERRFSSWVGGSVLASLGTFQQLWVSKGEYDEHGANIVFKKCP